MLGAAVCSLPGTSRMQGSPARLWVPELLRPALPCVLAGRCSQGDTHREPSGSKPRVGAAEDSFTQGASLVPSSHAAAFPQQHPAQGGWVPDQALQFPAQRLTSENLGGK